METNDLIKEEMKRFQQIIEYTTVRNGLVDEAEPSQDEAEPSQEDNRPDDREEGEQQGFLDQDEESSDNGRDGGMQIPDSGEQMTQGGPQGLNPQEDEGEMGMPEMDDSIEPDDEVIDISDLTDIQDQTNSMVDKTNSKVDKINSKFEKVLKYLSNFEKLIKSNDEKINDLRDEIEKRNPTNLEKLSMQTANSYPFNITPAEYWNHKEKTSNYRTESDDNGREQPQYTITRGDIDGSLDWKSISDSLSDFDPYHQTMKNTVY